MKKQQGEENNSFLYEDESEFDFLLRNMKGQQLGSTTDEERELSASRASTATRKKKNPADTEDYIKELDNIKKNIQILQSQLATIQSNTLKNSNQDTNSCSVASSEVKFSI